MSSADAATRVPGQGQQRRQFAAFWAAATVSAIGDGMTIVAIPLLAASVTDDPRAVAGIRIAALLPWLTLGLAAGVIADRVSRRRLAAYVNAVRVAMLAVVAVVAAQDLTTLLPVYLLVLLLGIAQTLFDSAAQALLPEIVPPERLERANGRLAAGQAIGLTFIGPPLGGLLFAWQPAAPFAIDAVSFAVAGALILVMRTGYGASHPSTSDRSVARFVGDIGRGLRYVWDRTLLRTMLIISAVSNFASGMANGVMVLFAAQVLGLSNTGFGLLVTFESAGALIGSLVAGRIGGWLGTWWTLRISIFLAGLCTLLLGLTRTPEIAYSVAALDGLAIAVWSVAAVSVRQRRIPADMLGRTAAFYRSAGLGSTLLGALVGGYVAYLTGLYVPFLVGGVLACAVVAVGASRLADDEAPAPAVTAASTR
jgi:MFS family permease